MREKYNLINELQKNEELTDRKKLALIGQGDFTGGNNVMRGTMNIKHHTQHLTINNPEFPFLYDGKENVMGLNSSYINITDKDYKVISICKKYNELMKGKPYFALYFLYNEKDDEYKVYERKEVEDLTENFGFSYNNDYIDNLEEGDFVEKGTRLNAATSYDEYNNAGIGVNGRLIHAIHPAVQDDAILISESFAKRMMSNVVTSITIPLDDNMILLNKYGDEERYQGLPNIGDVIHDHILCAVRPIKENRIFSDLRDQSLSQINEQLDQVYYGSGEVVDINIYCNRPNATVNKINKQLIQYYNDAKWFYTQVYKITNKIIKSGAKNIDKEINRWRRLSMNYLDTEAVWAFNDNVFNNMMIEILLRKEETLSVGKKIVGPVWPTLNYVNCWDISTSLKYVNQYIYWI